MSRWPLRQVRGVRMLTLETTYRRGSRPVEDGSPDAAPVGAGD
ncbi:hypothetical protein SDC9_167108 [bioreactor metagenome]|uniref:Uncharacterized protein n=1 Tax=bioreactor metagenome TaxID=1076179 RepID=A0A645G0S4_9ZZZZ